MANISLCNLLQATYKQFVLFQYSIFLDDNVIKMQFVTHTENRNDAEYLVIDNILYESNAKRYNGISDFIFFTNPLFLQNVRAF